MSSIVSPFTGGPVDPTPCTLYVKSFGERGRKHFFLNNKEDNAGGTVAHPDALRLPVRDWDEKEPHFSDILLPFMDGPKLEEKIICLRQPTHHRDRGRAHFWAPGWLWNLQRRNFVVLREAPNGTVTEYDEFAGAWGMSVHYATNSWDNGVICQHNGATYTIVEVVTDHLDREFYLVPEEDPRLDYYELPEEFRGLSTLPNQ